MKKNLLLIICATILSVTAAQAQETKFGIKAGINSANFGSDSDTKTVIGFHFGPYVSIGITDKFALQPELLYSTQGAEISANNVTSSESLSYINLPIMAKIYVANGFNIQVGPYVGVLLNFDSESDDTSVAAGVDYKGFDYGVGLGLAYEFDGGFNFGGRYNFGLADVQDVDTNNGTVVIDGSTNQVIQFFLGYSF